MEGLQETLREESKEVDGDIGRQEMPVEQENQEAESLGGEESMGENRKKRETGQGEEGCQETQRQEDQEEKKEGSRRRRDSQETH